MTGDHLRRLALALPEVEALARGEETGAPAKAAQEVKNYLAAMRRKEEAIDMAAQGQRVDPLSLLGNFGPGSISVFTRQWGLATQQLRGAIDLDATYWLDHIFLGRAYVRATEQNVGRLRGL